MTAKKNKQDPDFPPLTCRACRFCLGDRKDGFECWSQPPRHQEPEDIGNNRGEPIDPNWPACYFFIARENG